MPLNRFLDLALPPALSDTLSWEMEMSDTEQKCISGPCCMLITPETSGEGRGQKMSGLSRYRGRGDVETVLSWNSDRYVQ